MNFILLSAVISLSVYQSSLPAYFILIQIINLEERTSAEDEKPMDPWPERIHRRSFNFTMIWVIQIQITPQESTLCLPTVQLAD